LEMSHERGDLDNEPGYRQPIKIDLETLFDFTEKHWIVELAKSAHASFNEELALRDMLALDTEGKDDLDFNISEDCHLFFDD